MVGSLHFLQNQRSLNFGLIEEKKIGPNFNYWSIYEGICNLGVTIDKI